MLLVAMGGRVARIVTVAALFAAGMGVATTPAGSSSFPGANGKIAFTSNRDGNDEIYVMEPDGTDETNLTRNPASDSQPSWSADGERLAFVSDRDGNREIHVIDADGTDETNLTNDPADDSSPSWSPDGEHIAFTSFRGGKFGIYVMDDDGTHQTLLTESANGDLTPSWSPDGEHIAFSRFVGANIEIFVMDDDGTDQRNLTNHPATDDEANWSPDGDHIAFTSLRDGSFGIHVMRPDGTDQTRLTQDTANDFTPAWSPDGEHIAFAREGAGTRIYVMDDDGTDETRLTDDDGRDPDWQPREADGDVTVTKWVNGTPPPGTTYEIKIDCDGEQDDKVLTFGETGGTQTIEREGFGPLECEVTETQTGGAATVEITCGNGQNADCKQNGKFALFDDPGGDDTHVEINVTNSFAVTAEPTFTG